MQDKLGSYFKEKGLTQDAIARRFGVSQAYINGLLTGKRPFGKKQAQRWNEEFGFSEAWLLTGKGAMFEETESDLPPVTRVPLIPEAAFAGGIRAVSEGILSYECEKITSPYPNAQYAIRVSGKSMEPEFPDGCLVFLNRLDATLFIPWGSPHVVDTENGAILKNIYPIEDSSDYFEARSCNPAYPPFRVPFNACYGFYKVLGMLKTYSLQ